MLRHLLIDFDRTLNDSDMVYERNLDGFLGLGGPEVLEHWEAIHREILAKEPRERHEDLEHHYKVLLEKLREGDPAQTKAELRKRIRAAQQECWDATALFEDALPFLLALKAFGHTLHIATGDFGQQKAAAVELQAGRSLFDRAFDESVLGTGKGKRDYFDRALRRLGVPPSDVLVFGDSLSNDIGPAMECGIPAVWVRRKGEKASDRVAPTLTVTSLFDALCKLDHGRALPQPPVGGAFQPELRSAPQAAQGGSALQGTR
jgi:FMN phosphatase YigB (HAD superfamily)